MWNQYLFYINNYTWHRVHKYQKYKENISISYWEMYFTYQSVQFSCSVMSNSSWPHELQHTRPPYPTPTPGVHPNPCPLGRWWHPATSCPSPPALNLSQHQGLFQWVSSLHQVAKVLEFQLQHQSFQWTPRTDLLQDGLVGSPCSPRDSQKSSPTP